MPCLRGPRGTVLFYLCLTRWDSGGQAPLPHRCAPQTKGVPLGQTLSPLHCPPKLGGPKDRSCLPFVAP